MQAAIFAPALAKDATAEACETRAKAIKALRDRGERVVDALPGEVQAPAIATGEVIYSCGICDRILVQMQGKWVVQAC